MAPGDVGFWQGALRDPATEQFKAVAAAVEAGDPMMLSVLYGDWEGGQRVISQFALRHVNDKWLTSTGRHFNVTAPTRASARRRWHPPEPLGVQAIQDDAQEGFYRPACRWRPWAGR